MLVALFPKYHPRKRVDCSSSAYRKCSWPCFSNTTHGSGWIVQVQPKGNARGLISQIPPTEAGGLFKFSLQEMLVALFPKYHPRKWVDCSSSAYRKCSWPCFPNTTHGSGWIVQVQPTR